MCVCGGGGGGWKLALSCIKSLSQISKSGRVNLYIILLKQKTALSLKPIKYISAVDSTIPGGVKHSETQGILPCCHTCNCAYIISHDDVLH